MDFIVQVIHVHCQFYCRIIFVINTEVLQCPHLVHNYIKVLLMCCYAFYVIICDGFLSLRTSLTGKT